ncbi:hypothetical protein K1719_036333 [Acacia pycnantha]|nr:hypothetical protein K1719_036333 [Acacia pycnantha]
MSERAKLLLESVNTTRLSKYYRSTIEISTEWTQSRMANRTLIEYPVRIFLRWGHPYRRLKKAFFGSQEYEEAPVALTGEQVYEKVKNISVIFGKTGKSRKETNIWKKRSVFFDLPYWRNLDVREVCIDVMHVEKNVCDSIVGTLLNIQGSSKDGVKAILDLQAMGIREDLHPRPYGKRTYCPPTSHTLSKDEKRSFFECLHGTKVPSGKVFEIEKLDELENEGYLILCQLEKLLVPTFLTSWFIDCSSSEEIRLCGPIHLRWMYPIEISMKFLKGYVKNASAAKHQLLKYVSKRP